MKLVAQIDMDCKCLERYFQNLLHLLKESQEAEARAPLEVSDTNSNESEGYHGFSHFIKPDMIINIYSLVDFWMSQICEYQRKRKNLSLKAKDIKGDDDLDARHKYLTKYAGLNLGDVNDSYKRLNELRIVRNKFIHGGGHLNGEEDRKFSAIEGIVISGSLIVIEENFIWSQLSHSRRYLVAAV